MPRRGPDLRFRDDAARDLSDILTFRVGVGNEHLRAPFYAHQHDDGKWYIRQRDAEFIKHWDGETLHDVLWKPVTYDRCLERFIALHNGTADDVVRFADTYKGLSFCGHPIEDPPPPLSTPLLP